MAAWATALDRRRQDYATLRRTLTFPRPADSEVTVLAAEEFLPEDPSQAIQLGDSNALVSLASRSVMPDIRFADTRAVLDGGSELPHRHAG